MLYERSPIHFNTGLLKKQTEIQAGEEAPDTGGKKKFKGNGRHICTDRVTDTLHGICAEEKCIGYITKT